MKTTLFLILIIFGASSASAQDDASKDDQANAEAPKTETATEEGRYIKDLTAKEKHQLEDQIAAEIVAEHNALTESELDEVVCEKVIVTGSRQKKRVCKTRRQIQAEEAGKRALMRQRNRSSSVAPLPTNALP